jgi:predicted nucleotidyltransferase
MDLLPDFKDLLSALADSNADYLVIGGWAVGFHGEPRYTKDLDLLIGVDPANLTRVASALETFGAPPGIVEQVRALTPDEFLFVGTPPARVDILRSVPGIDFAEAHARREQVTWDGVSVSIIAFDDLVASKRAAGREKDERDVRALLRMRAH